MPEVFTNANSQTTKPSPAVVQDDIGKTTEVKSNMPIKHRPGFKEIFASFIRNPHGIRFETQETDEEVLVLLRAHPITNFGWIAIAVILSISPMIIVPVLTQIKFISSNIPMGYFVIVPYLWYLGILHYCLTNFLQWYFNVYIVTNERVVDVDWYSLLFKKLSSAKLEKIQDVSYKQGGLIDSFFDFGNVHIQTAGTDPNFDYEHIPQPDKVVREINTILETYKPKQRNNI